MLEPKSPTRVKMNKSLLFLGNFCLVIRVIGIRIMREIANLYVRKMIGGKSGSVYLITGPAIPQIAATKTRSKYAFRRLEVMILWFVNSELIINYPFSFFTKDFNRTSS